jgi:hypothetical protein
MAEISPVMSKIYQTTAFAAPHDEKVQYPFPKTSDKGEPDSGVRVDISKVGKALAGSTEDVLSEKEQRQVKALQDRDREVRSHEQAHIAAGGGLIRGAATYQYRSGPDGHLYAVGGEVSIDTSVVSNDPDATIRKAEQIKRAAQAPADPSSADRAIAAQADAMAADAQRVKAESKKSGGKATISAAPMHFSAGSSLMSKPKPLSEAAIG